MPWPAIIGAFGILAASFATGYVTLKVTRANIAAEDKLPAKVDIVFNQSQELVAAWKDAYESSTEDLEDLKGRFDKACAAMQRELEIWRTAAHLAYMEPESDWWPAGEPKPMKG